MFMIGAEWKVVGDGKPIAIPLTASSVHHNNDSNHHLLITDDGGKTWAVQKAS
jgi:hypothetical protein